MAGTMIAIAQPDGTWLPLVQPAPEPLEKEQEPPQQELQAPIENNVVVLDTARDDIERISDLLAEVIRISRGLSETDARKARDLAHAFSGLMVATNYLPSTLQDQFERSLRKR